MSNTHRAVSHTRSAVDHSGTAPSRSGANNGIAAVDSESKPAGRPNLRHYHRINTEFDARITRTDTPQGKQAEHPATLHCQLTNLSRAGIMAVCTPEMIEAILPNGAAVGPRQAVRVAVEFGLPILDVQTVQIQAQCDVVYLRRISRNTFHLGMSFVAFDGSGQDYVNQYVDRHLPRV